MRTHDEVDVFDELRIFSLEECSQISNEAVMRVMKHDRVLLVWIGTFFLEEIDQFFLNSIQFQNFDRKFLYDLQTMKI